MDVKMPDGTIIRNVPPGTTRAQLQARLGKAGNNPDRTGFMGYVDTALRGATDMMTFGTGDKIAAAANSVLPVDKLTNPNIKSVWETGDLGGAFRNNLHEEQRIAADDNQNRFKTRLGGQVVGGVIGPVPGQELMAKLAAGGAKAAVRKGIIGASKARFIAGAGKIAADGAIQQGLHGLGSGDSTSISERIGQGENEALSGALGSMFGAGVVRGGAKLLSPVISPAVAKLAQMGVIMTPGQRAGAGTITNWAENMGESIPGLGVAIRAAKRRGIEQFNRGAINAALAPIAAKLPKKAQAGRTAVEAAQDLIGDHYDDALAKVRAPADHIFQSDMAATASSAGSLPPNAAKTFDYVISNKVKPLLSGNVMDGPAFQDVTRTLQGLSSKADDGTVEGELLADHLKAVRQHFIDLAQRHSPEGANAFLKANQAEANMSRVYKAAKGADNGVFTPNQLATATAAKGYGTTIKNAAAGNARMQDVSDAGKAVLPNTFPNSGSADRYLAAGAVGGTGAGAAMLNPAVVGLAAPAVPYMPGVDALLQKIALRGQGKNTKALADQIRKRAYIGGIFGAPAINAAVQPLPQGQ